MVITFDRVSDDDILNLYKILEEGYSLSHHPRRLYLNWIDSISYGYGKGRLWTMVFGTEDVMFLKSICYMYTIRNKEVDDGDISDRCYILSHKLFTMIRNMENEL